MRKKYAKLFEEYPEYISLDQMRVICRIAKRTARFLLENGIVPCENTGKKTWRYKIKLVDVIAYLQEREEVGSRLPSGMLSSRSPYIPKVPLIREAAMRDQLSDYFQYIYENYPELLLTPDASEMTGLDKATILSRIRSGDLKAKMVTHLGVNKYIIAKQDLIAFTSSASFLEARTTSETFKKIIGGFEIWHNLKSSP